MASPVLSYNPAPQTSHGPSVTTGPRSTFAWTGGTLGRGASGSGHDQQDRHRPAGATGMTGPGTGCRAEGWAEDTWNFPSLLVWQCPSRACSSGSRLRIKGNMVLEAPLGDMGAAWRTGLVSPGPPQEADGWQEGRDPAVCTFGDRVKGHGAVGPCPHVGFPLDSWGRGP